MPDSHCAKCRVGSQISLEPLPFRRGGGAAFHAGRACADVVDHNDVPRAVVVTVIAFGGITCERPEIIEVTLSVRSDEIVNAGCRGCPGPMAAPSCIVTSAELSFRSIRIRKVACHEYLSRDRIQQCRRG